MRWVAVDAVSVWRADATPRCRCKGGVCGDYGFYDARALCPGGDGRGSVQSAGYTDAVLGNWGFRWSRSGWVGAGLGEHFGGRFRRMSTAGRSSALRRKRAARLELRCWPGRAWALGRAWRRRARRPSGWRRRLSRFMRRRWIGLILSIGRFILRCAGLGEIEWRRLGLE